MNKQQTWNLLAKVAQSKSAEAQTQLVKARQNLEEVAKSEKRLQDLYADYSVRLQPGGPSCTMAEAKNLRGFIEHIETLHQSLIRNRIIAERAVQGATRVFTLCETHRARMEGLAERALRQEQKLLQAKENKQMDALGISQYIAARG